MTFKTLALVLLGLSLSTAAVAQESKCEVTYAFAKGLGVSAAQNEKGTAFKELDGEDARKLLAAINALPPATDFKADRLLIISRPSQDRITIGFVLDGCLSTAGDLHVADFIRAVSNAFHT